MSEIYVRAPILFCFCAPTASGKSTICRAVVEQDAALHLSISTTTRSPRQGERDGVHYHFVTEEEFLRRIDGGAFIEHAEFGRQRYGTERSNLEGAGLAGKDIVLDIDVQGVRRLKTLFAAQIVTIFVFPPSFKVLEDRLLKRGTESSERRKERLQAARDELRTLRGQGFSEYLLINDDLPEAIAGARAIIAAERQRFSRFTEEYLRRLFGDA